MKNSFMRHALHGARRWGRYCAAAVALAGAFANTAFAQLSMLHTSGRSIVNANGTVVQLQGVNLGGWFIMEKWMCPLDSGSLPDTYSVMQTLDQPLRGCDRAEPHQDLSAEVDHEHRPE